MFDAETSAPDYAQGYGAVRLGNVLRVEGSEAWDDAAMQVLFVPNANVSEGQVWRRCLRVGLGLSQAVLRNPRVTLVWTDPMPSFQSFRRLVNDLDLRVSNGQGRVYLGNRFMSRDEVNGEYAVPDDLNNVEVVDFPSEALDKGLLLVEVIGTDVSLGPQKFSMVMSGSLEDVDVEECAAMDTGCINNCSGHGRCLDLLYPLSNTSSPDGDTRMLGCDCALTHRGISCELANKEMELGVEYSATIALHGWNYYSWPQRAGAVPCLRPLRRYGAKRHADREIAREGEERARAAEHGRKLTKTRT
jgi:hypothetical protein